MPEWERFVKLAIRSGLLSKSDFSNIRMELSRSLSGAPLCDTEFLALIRKALIELGILTNWQCNKLSEGRYRGFFIGDNKYKLLDHAETVERGCILNAQDTRSGKKVRVVIMREADLLRYTIVDEDGVLEQWSSAYSGGKAESDTWPGE